jgi:hypothetical protein
MLIKREELLGGTAMHGVSDWALAFLAEEAPSAAGISGWWNQWGGEAVACLVGMIVSQLGSACLGWINRRSVIFWARLTWFFHFKLGFWCRQHRARRNARIICLEEYVDELTAARSKIAEYVRKKIGAQKCTIQVRVFTQQLPSNWPLWVQGASDELLRTTPLGRYIVGFGDFVNQEGDYKGLKVEVVRYIVIDRIAAPNTQGIDRKNKLKKDTGETWYPQYLKLLHGEHKEGARFLEYLGVWPGWLTDCVFFGLHMNDDPANRTKWLFGFTTTYNPDEDVLVYRYHYLPKPGPTPKDLPEGVNSFAEIPDSAALQKRSRPLSDLENKSEVK